MSRRIFLAIIFVLLLIALSGCINILKRYQVTITSTPLLESVTVGKRERELPYRTTAKRGDRILIKAPLVPGYDFAGWLVNNVLNEEANVEIVIEENTAIKAIYIPKLVNEITLGGNGDETGFGLIVESTSSLVSGVTSDSTDSNLIVGNNGGFDFWVPPLEYISNSFLVSPRKAHGGSGDDFLSDTTRITGGTVSVGWTDSEDIPFTGSGYPYHGGIDAYAIMLLNDGTIGWQTYIGGSGDDYAHSVNVTVGERLILTGSTGSNDSNFEGTGQHGDIDGWASIMSSYGTLVSNLRKSFGGSGTDELFYGVQTRDGGYLLCGYSKSSDGDLKNIDRSQGEDLWILKVDSELNILWQDLLGGTADERAHVVKEVSDGLIVAGYTASTGRDVNDHKGGKDIWVLKFKDNGELLWSKTYGGTNDEEAFDIIETADGGYAVCGYTKSTNRDVRANKGMSDVWVIKLGMDGYLEWEATFGGTQNDSGRRIGETEKRELIVIGTTSSNDRDVLSGLHGGTDAWLLRLGK